MNSSKLFKHEYIRDNWAPVANTRISIEVAKDLSRFVWEDFAKLIEYKKLTLSELEEYFLKGIDVKMAESKRLKLMPISSDFASS